MQAIKFLIDSGTTTLMVNNVWNLLNTDNFQSHTVYSLNKLGEIINYLK